MPPHIVHIVGDDIGWNDLGISNPSMLTPNIDQLANDGIKLEYFYAAKECAPSRTSIMTGRTPFKYGYYQNPSDDGGVPLNYTMIPTVLKAQGYSTHAVGKWHAGFRTANHTPTYRGFDSFLGYWHWGEEYTSHIFPPYYKQAKCRGVDFTNATGSQLEPLLHRGAGVQSSKLFVTEVERILATRQPSQPLYLYLAFQNAHDPYEHAPPELVAQYSHEANLMRRNFSAIVSDMDRAIGAVVKLLEAAAMWQDTVLWFNSDNGAELPFADQSSCNSACHTTACCGGAGNNAPLRGGKFTVWEGGIRSRSFVYTKSLDLLPKTRRGSTWRGLSHVSDLFATFAHLSGAPARDSAETDGYNLWPALREGGSSPRQELLHQPLNMFWNVSCTPADLSNPFTPSCGAAFTQWPYKLIIGFAGDNRTVVPPHLTAGAAGASPTSSRTACAEQPCLFDISSDPTESHDIAQSHPGLLAKLHGRLLQLSVPEALPQPADALTPNPSDKECSKVVETGAWQPWEAADLDHEL